jgi:hypothetical protein
MQEAPPPGTLLLAQHVASFAIGVARVVDEAAAKAEHADAVRVALEEWENQPRVR